METAGTGSVTAVVLGGGSGDPLADRARVSFKAQVPIAGKAMGAYVLEALQESRRVDRILFVGDALPGFEEGPLVRVPAGPRLVDSLALGLGAALVFRPQRILVVTCDLPWLEGAAVDRFIEAAGDADIAYPVIPEAVAREQFPHVQRTFVSLRGGRFTGGNLFLFASARVPQLLPLAERAYRARKNPLALGAMVGWRVLIRFLLRSISLEDLEREIGARLGVRLRVVVSADASLATDIDHIDQLVPSRPLAEGQA